MTQHGDLSRYADLIGWLTDHSVDDPDVRVCLISGSAATGRFDAWSDLDVDLLCTPGTAVAAYQRWLSAIRATFDVRDVWELPEATWPDGRQCFVNLLDRPGLLAEPTRLIDAHIVDISDDHSHVDVRRHGTPIVLHDPDGELVLEDDDQDQMDRALAVAVDQVRQRRITGEWLVNRALKRGEVAEGVDLYLRFALGGLVRMLRAEHCPWRHDFGLRYLRADLPDDVAARVESLVPGATAASLEQLAADCYAWLDELLR